MIKINYVYKHKIVFKYKLFYHINTRIFSHSTFLHFKCGNWTIIQQKQNVKSNYGDTVWLVV